MISFLFILIVSITRFSVEKVAIESVHSSISGREIIG